MAKLAHPVKLFNSKRLRLFGSQPHTQADPFLLVDGETLFIFYEQVYPGGVGKIACVSTTDLEHFDDHGVILSRDHHLSWPFVFRIAGDIYMLPESQAAGEIALYRFSGLSGPVTKVRTLLTGRYADPFLIERDSIWYLFATSNRGLELFTAADPLTEDFKPHPQSPVATDRRYSRSGGAPMKVDGALMRVAQDCSATYGDNVSIIEITRLDPHGYEEKVIRDRFFDRNEPWNRDGAHHLCVTRFKGQTVIAADGKHRDYWINKFLPRGRKNIAPPTELIRSETPR